VKTLAGQTSEATTRIARQIEAIRGQVQETAGALDEVVGTIEVIDGAAVAAQAAVATQRAAVDLIATQGANALSIARRVAGDVAQVAGRVERARDLAQEAAAEIDETVRLVGDLGDRAVVSLRGGAADERRAARRVPIELSVGLAVGGRRMAGRTRNLSEGGLLVSLDGGSVVEPGPAELDLELETVGTCRCRVVRGGAAGLHLALERPSAEAAERLRHVVRRVEEEDARFVETAKRAKREMEAALEGALAAGRIDEAGLFDTDYIAVPGSEPRQFVTRFTALTDALFTPVQEAVLASSPRIVFCAAMDRNCYLPTHNRKFSHPQRAGDPVWNAANARNRRKFDDRAGVCAARNRREHLVQSYERDMGGGKIASLKEVDVPLTVGGRHWGCLRLAYTLR
jgi:hypothetical protein